MMSREIIHLVFVVTITTLWLNNNFANSSKPELPRSVVNRKYYTDDEGITPPLWLPSSQIDKEGFLMRQYSRIPSELEDAISGKHHKSNLVNVPVRVRQVPGDGNCLFHSVTVCLNMVENETHYSYENNEIDDLRNLSRILRERAVDYLTDKPKRKLYLQGDEYWRAKELLEQSASQYSCTPQEYCNNMRKESYWGGGPEVVAICNLLKRPIHIYELYSSQHKNQERENDHFFRLRRMACFGSPRFDRKEALHILSADSRFPDVIPGEQLPEGNHFMAMFPLSTKTATTKKRILRGGGVNTRHSIEKQLQQSSSTNIFIKYYFLQIKKCFDTIYWFTNLLWVLLIQRR